MHNLPLVQHNTFFADSILKKICSTNVERNHSFYITIIDEGFWGLQVWWPRMTPLYNNYWTIGTPSLVNSLPNIETWWIMDAIGVSSMTNPLDKALWANLVCTEKLSFSRDAAGRGWKIHKPWVSSILMKMELSIFLSQQGNISRCMQMWCETLLDSTHLGSWSHLWGRWI